MATADVTIPGDAIDPAKKDVLAPLLDVLRGVDILAKEGATSGGVGKSPDPSVAIIESGATSLSKVWTAAVSALGGATAITTVATRFWSNLQGNERVAAVAATGAVIAAAIIALAIIVSADVRGRALGTTEIYAARARIAERFLQVSATAKQPVAKAATPPPLDQVIEQLRQLKAAHDEGLISADELADKRAKLLTG